MNEQYKSQVKLLLQVLPYFMRERKFALKGGSAINLFYQNMPRLSVDIDLTYLPIEDRKTSFISINTAFQKIASELKIRFPSLRLQFVKTGEENIKQIILRDFNATVKVEINHILRGAMNTCQSLDLCVAAQETFGTFVSALCLSREDLYAGKICAALDRQHPRDLFDIKNLLNEQNIDESLRKIFIIYLISNNRPISELLNPNRLSMHLLYQRELHGMTLIYTSYEELEAAREALISQIDAGFTENEKQFLITFKSGDPNWNLLGIKKCDYLPAIQWKLQNIRRMEPQKREHALEKLKRKLKL